MWLSPEALLGPYRLVERLADSGPCEVWRALQPDTAREIAIRFFPQRWSGRPDYLARFQREAAGLRRVHHPNVLTVLDYGEQEGRTYLVTPLLDGLTLDHLLGAPWPPDDALQVLEPLASALDFAHGRRVIHRDLRPESVFITDEGGVVLDGLGFGWDPELSFDEPESAPPGAGPPRRRPSHVAPELLEGRPADAASDLYALGAIAFELLVGRAPFEREIWPAELAPRPGWAQSQPCTLPGELPEAIAAFLHRALADDPASRFPTAGALVRALRAASGMAEAEAPSEAVPAAPGSAGEQTDEAPSLAPAGRLRRLRTKRARAGLAASALLVVLTYLLVLQPALALLAGRGGHAAVLLSNGEVLVAGGCANVPPGGSLAALLAHLRTLGARQPTPGLLEGTAIYTQGGWRPAARMSQPRCGLQALLLSNGQTLAVGGNPPADQPVATAERHDPSTNNWYAAGKLLIPRGEYSLTALTTGQALVAGGANLASQGEPLASAERYSPASNSWGLAASLHEARKQHAASLLPSGEVLVSGGVGVRGVSLAGAERYDPIRNDWSVAGHLQQARARHTATVLASGQVLIVGGAAERSRVASAERYDPATGSWARAAPLHEARADHTATLLPDGRLLIVGGTSTQGDLATAERYDPEQNLWAPAGVLPQPRSGHSATLLPNGRVLVVGGRQEGVAMPYLSTAVLYDPEQNRWSSAPDLLP